MTADRRHPRTQPAAIPASGRRRNARTRQELARAACAALHVDRLEPRRLFAAFSFTTDFITEAVATYPDGRVLAVGYEMDGNGDRQDVMRRFLANGDPDDTFGDNGRVQNGVTDDSAAYAVILQDDDPDNATDGRILVAGAAYADAGPGDQNPLGQSFTLSAYEADGDVDGGFGNGAGQIVIALDPGNPNNSSIAYTIAFQGSKIIVAGHTGDYFDDDTDDFALVRYNADGTPDDSFGDGGKMVTELKQNGSGQSFRDSIGAMIVEPNGKIVVAGTAGMVEVNGRLHSLVGICRYTADGDLDDSFSDDGILILNKLGTERYLKDDFTESSDFTVGLARTSGGKYIVAASTPDDLRDFGIVKLNSNGTPDGGFGDDGFVRTGMGGVDDADEVLLLGDSIVVVGTSANGNAAEDTSTYRTAIAVYQSDGDLDDDFGDGGKAFFDEETVSGQPPVVGPQAIHIGDVSRRAKAAAADGEIVVTRSNDDNESILRRLNADVAAPAASLAPVPAVTSAGGTGNDLVVTFSDIAAVDVSTIAASNLLVQKDGGMTVAVASATPDVATDGATRTVTYRLVAPGGTWDPADNGTYTVTLQSGQVADTSGNTVGTKNLGSFTVNVAAAAPTATFAGSSINAPGGATHTFTVTYADADGLVARGSLAPANVSVTGPGGPLVVTAVSAVPDADAGSIVAAYTVQAPGGSWDAPDTGEFTVNLLANQVRDTANNFTPAGTLGTFSVNLGGVPGAPAAALQPVGGVTAGAATHTFTVVYTDPDGVIDVATINAADVTVVRNGGTLLAVTNAVVNDDSNGTPRSVTYSVQAPGGSWNAADTGTYTIALAANQVADATGVFAPAGSLGTFNVNLGTGTGPGAAAVADVTSRGASTYEFTVTYTPTIGSSLDVATLGDNDLRVVGPGGFTAAPELVAVDGNAATYRFLPPGGTWNVRDAGAYTVSLQSGSVLDTTGGPIGSGNLGSFNVAIAAAGGTSLGTFGTVNGVKTTLPVTDGDGTVTLLTLTGGGSGEAFQNGDRLDLVLTGTTGASALSLKAKGGDGRVRLGDVAIEGGLRQVNGKTADLAGEFTATSAVGKILLGNVTDAAINITGDGGLTTIQLGQVTNASVTSVSPIKSLKLLGWADDGAADVITAPTISGLAAKGDFAADLDVQTLGNLKVTGALSGARVTSAGAIGKVTAGSMTNSRVFAAVAETDAGLPSAGTAFSNDATTLAGVSVKGPFSNSLIAAPSVGKVALGTATTANNGTPFGVAANRVKNASANANGRITVKNAEDPSQTVGQGDFTIRLL